LQQRIFDAKWQPLLRLAARAKNVGVFFDNFPRSAARSRQKRHSLGLAGALASACGDRQEILALHKG
jgi:hypothetical protein